MQRSRTRWPCTIGLLRCRHKAGTPKQKASILDALGRHDEAEPLFRHAGEVFERLYGPEHYEIAVNLNNLAALHQARGELTQAEALAGA